MYCMFKHIHQKNITNSGVKIVKSSRVVMHRYEVLFKLELAWWFSKKIGCGYSLIEGKLLLC